MWIPLQRLQLHTSQRADSSRTEWVCATSDAWHAHYRWARINRLKRSPFCRCRTVRHVQANRHDSVSIYRLCILNTIRTKILTQCGRWMRPTSAATTPTPKTMYHCGWRRSNGGRRAPQRNNIITSSERAKKRKHWFLCALNPCWQYNFDVICSAGRQMCTNVLYFTWNKCNVRATIRFGSEKSILYTISCNSA